MRKQGSLHVLTSLILWDVPDIVYWRTHLMATLQSANSGKLLRLLGTNHVPIGHDYQTLPTCSINAKPLNLWSFERHRSHAKCDRKRTAHVSTSMTEYLSHRIQGGLEAGGT